MKNTKCTKTLIVLVLTVFSLNCKGSATAANGKVAESNSTDAGSIKATRSMTTQRAAHTATLLADGKVLIAGGFAGNESSMSSAEIFDSATSTFGQVGRMNATRASHSATLLPDGKVLIAGGYNGDYLATAELYDPATRAFVPAGKMVTGRSGHIATLLNNGKVLLAGGTGTGWTFLTDAEVYDPISKTFTATGGMTTARESHTATLLRNGNVLITGGHKDRRTAITIYSSAEIYDPAKGTFTSAGNMTIKRHKHDATLLADGRVLIVGGSDERDGRGDTAYRNAEVFNPTTGIFAAVGAANVGRYKLQGTTILLKSGKVLIAGGANRAEVFNPATNSFSFADGNMGTTRLFATATLLANGQVLITGGYDDHQAVSANAWLYVA